MNDRDDSIPAFDLVIPEKSGQNMRQTPQESSQDIYLDGIKRKFMIIKNEKDAA